MGLHYYSRTVKDYVAEIVDCSCAMTSLVPFLFGVDRRFSQGQASTALERYVPSYGKELRCVAALWCLFVAIVVEDVSARKRSPVPKVRMGTDVYLDDVERITHVRKVRLDECSPRHRVACRCRTTHRLDGSLACIAMAERACSAAYEYWTLECYPAVPALTSIGPCGENKNPAAAAAVLEYDVKGIGMRGARDPGVHQLCNLYAMYEVLSASPRKVLHRGQQQAVMDM